MGTTSDHVGLWLIGACGGVGSAVSLGIAALAKRLIPTIGLVSELPPFGKIDLVNPGSLVVGGHEIRPETLLEAIQDAHARARLFDENLIRAAAPRLRAFQHNIRPGTLCGASRAVQMLAEPSSVKPDRSPAQAVERIAADIKAFRRGHRLDRVIVVNVASAEASVPRSAAHGTYRKLQRALARPGSAVLPTSSLYALGAIEAGCPFINFTSSLGVDVPAIRERAEQLGLPYMGSDGKTGETLVKSALAPMFAMRNLSVLSWVGQNILGNRDGANLNDPRVRASKIRTKDKTVSRILGKSATTRISIDYVPSLDDWKVAWDFIHFEGFLGTKMTMQFTWQGSDSVLAAPLVIDLVRFSDLACRNGASGPMRHLACFFKDPIDVREKDLFTQWQMLVTHLAPGRRRH